MASYRSIPSRESDEHDVVEYLALRGLQVEEVVGAPRAASIFLLVQAEVAVRQKRGEIGGILRNDWVLTWRRSILCCVLIV